MINRVFILILGLICFGCNSTVDPVALDIGTYKNGVYQNHFFNLKLNLPAGYHFKSASELNELLFEQTEVLKARSEDVEKALDTVNLSEVTLFLASKFPLDSAGLKPGQNTTLIMLSEKRPQTELEDLKAYLAENRDLLKETQLSYSFPKPIYEKQFGTRTFSVLETAITAGDITLIQHYYTTYSNGFVITFIATFGAPLDLLELHASMDSMEWKG